MTNAGRTTRTVFAHLATRVTTSSTALVSFRPPIMPPSKMPAAKFGTIPTTSVQSALITGSSRTVFAHKSHPTAKPLTSPLVSVFPVSEVTILLTVPVSFLPPTTPPPLMPAARPGSTAHAKNAQIISHSTPMESALLSQTSARPTKAWAAPAASMDLLSSTDPASSPLSIPPPPPTPAAQSGTGTNKFASAARLTGTSSMEFAPPFLTFAEHTTLRQEHALPATLAMTLPTEAACFQPNRTGQLMRGARAGIGPTKFASAAVPTGWCSTEPAKAFPHFARPTIQPAPAPPASRDTPWAMEPVKFLAPFAGAKIRTGPVSPASQVSSFTKENAPTSTAWPISRFIMLLAALKNWNNLEPKEESLNDPPPHLF